MRRKCQQKNTTNTNKSTKQNKLNETNTTQNIGDPNIYPLEPITDWEEYYDFLRNQQYYKISKPIKVAPKDTNQKVCIEKFKCSVAPECTEGKNFDKYASSTINWGKTIETTCCVELLKHLAIETTNILRNHSNHLKYDNKWFFSFGTAIGILRNNMIIPWTQDVDMSVNVDLFHEMMDSDSKLAKEFWNAGFAMTYSGIGRLCYHTQSKVAELIKASNGGKKVENTIYFWSPSAPPYLDIYPLHEYKTLRNKIRVHNFGTGYIDKNSLFPVRYEKLHGVDVPVPWRLEEYLVSQYGPTVIIPNTRTNTNREEDGFQWKRNV